MKITRIAINGFGRIGRSFFRTAFGLPEFDIVAVNDLTDTKNLAYLLKYDSVYGRYQKNVEAKDGHFLVYPVRSPSPSNGDGRRPGRLTSNGVDGKEVKVLAEKEPGRLPWKDLKIDIVIESTGFFASEAKSRPHLDAGAKRVVITAPADGVMTALIGVNDDRFKNPHPITCNASCTTNSVAPVIRILLDNFGVQKAGMVTVHGYTATQKLVDGPDVKDPRRGRAAAINIVPSTTGATEAVIKAIPELEGKFDAIGVRVPTIAGSLSAMTVLLEKKSGAEEINQVFKKSAKELRWAKILKVTEDPIVSTDIIGEPYGAIVDLSLTKVVDGDLAQVFSWYDNEGGYTATLVEHVRRVAQNIKY